MKLLYKILIILSPLLLTLLIRPLDKSGLYFTVDLVLTLIIGIPFITIVGLSISFLTRKSQKAEIYSLLGYLVAAIPVWLYFIRQFVQLLT